MLWGKGLPGLKFGSHIDRAVTSTLSVNEIRDPDVHGYGKAQRDIFHFLLRQAYPELAAELKRRLSGQLPSGWEKNLPEFPADAKGMATRGSEGKVLNALTHKLT